MEVSITHSGIANSVQVSASIPNIVSVMPNSLVSVEVQLFRDGKNGKDGKDGIDAADRDIDGGVIF